MKTMRIQHPQVLQRTDRKGTYWFFRFWLDERFPNGSIKSIRKFYTIGPSQGPGALSHREAEAIRDRVLAGLAPSSPQQTDPMPQPIPSDHGSILFGQLAEMWRYRFCGAG